MVDWGEGDVNRTRTEDIYDVCRGVHAELSILHGMSTEQGAKMADHGCMGGRNCGGRGTVKEHGVHEDVKEDFGNDSVAGGMIRLGIPRGLG